MILKKNNTTLRLPDILSSFWDESLIKNECFTKQDNDKNENEISRSGKKIKTIKTKITATS